MSVLGNLLSKGYFPKELPPAFTTGNFARVMTHGLFKHSGHLITPNAKNVLVHPKNGISRICKHSLARLDGTSRLLHIPHPAHFFYLCQELDSKWTEIEDHLKKSTLSISKPETDPASIRAYIPSKPGSARPMRRIKDRSQGNVLIIADITNFYGTVYTHSLPWALHTKPIAKNNRNNPNFLGNAIDTLLRNGQDGQTSGIPIGPDTSFVMAEVVLASIDEALQAKHPNLIGFRFYDDYEIVCEDEFSARQILAGLETQVLEYELSLNQRKTRVMRLPDEVDHSWLTELRQFKLISDIKSGGYISQNEQLIDFANIVFALSKKYPNDPVLRYALVKTSTQLHAKQLWNIYQNFLLQIFRAEPQLSHLVAGEFLKYSRQGIKIDKLLLQKAIHSHILKYISTRATNEIAWAIWMSILFNIKLDDQIADKISAISDNIVAILSFDAQNKGIFKAKLDTSLWQSKLTENHIYLEDWLINYEFTTKNWLNSADNSNYITSHQYSAGLNSHGVSFYDDTSYGDAVAILKRLEINVDLYTT